MLQDTVLFIKPWRRIHWQWFLLVLDFRIPAGLLTWMCYYFQVGQQHCFIQALLQRGILMPLFNSFYVDQGSPLRKYSWGWIFREHVQISALCAKACWWTLVEIVSTAWPSGILALFFCDVLIRGGLLYVMNHNIKVHSPYSFEAMIWQVWFKRQSWCQFVSAVTAPIPAK